jgi:pimeloyl-ACP methyl ester carboxylesterase
MTVVADGATLAFEDRGHGLPLVLLHAFPLDSRMWLPQCGALIPQCRCIMPDLRGFGGSEAVGPYSVDQYADDVAAILDSLRIERAVIAGLSLGGYVAFALWRRHRDRVRALILADTRAEADTAEVRARRMELAALARDKGPGAVAARQLPGLVGKTTREHNPDLYDSIHAMMLGASVDGIVGALEAMATRPDSTGLLGGIDVPTMVVCGEEDALTPIKGMRAMAEQIGPSRFEAIAGAGHLSNMERPAAFNHVVSEFLGSLVYD